MDTIRDLLANFKRLSRELKAAAAKVKAEYRKAQESAPGKTRSSKRQLFIELPDEDRHIIEDVN